MFTVEDPINHQEVQRGFVVSRIFGNEGFGYHKITVERPLRLSFQATAERIARLDDDTAFRNLAVSKKKAGPAHDAWIDHSKNKVGYEIPLNRHFYEYVPPRPLEVIEGDIRGLEEEIVALLRDVTASE